MVRSYVLIEMTAGHSRDLVNRLSRVAGVTEVARVTGPYDVIVTLEAQDLEEISDAVQREVHSLPGVVRTTTCVAIG